MMSLIKLNLQQWRRHEHQGNEWSTESTDSPHLCLYRCGSLWKTHQRPLKQKQTVHRLQTDPSSEERTQRKTGKHKSLRPAIVVRRLWPELCYNYSNRPDGGVTASCVYGQASSLLPPRTCHLWSPHHSPPASLCPSGAGSQEVQAGRSSESSGRRRLHHQALCRSSLLWNSNSELISQTDIQCVSCSESEIF